MNSEYEKYGRDPRTKKRYGRAWKRIRDKYAAEHPFCELCFERGVIVPMEEIPVQRGVMGERGKGSVISMLRSIRSVSCASSVE